VKLHNRIRILPDTTLNLRLIRWEIIFHPDYLKNLDQTNSRKQITWSSYARPDPDRVYTRDILSMGRYWACIVSWPEMPLVKQKPTKRMRQHANECMEVAAGRQCKWRPWRDDRTRCTQLASLFVRSIHP
jgi:hypothetical protein